MTDVRDTQQLHTITGRHHATIRTVCAHLRGPAGYAYPDAVEVLEQAPPDPILLTAAQAWTYLRIRTATIRQWVRRRELAPFDRDERGMRRYRAEDLARLAARPPAERDLITGRFTR